MSDRLRLLPLWSGVGFVACGVLLYASLMPSPPQLGGVPAIDKIEHFIAYLVLGAWFAAILPGRLLRIFVALSAFGLAIEVVQGMTGYRHAGALDFVADVAGVAAGVGLARLGAMRWLAYIDGYVAAKRNRA